jgi:serine protease AprX
MPDEPLYIKRITAGQAKSVLDDRRPQGGKPLKEVTPRFKAKLLTELDALIPEAALAPTSSPFLPVRVILEDNATAKTHRPDYLFPRGSAPIIGAGEPGELFVQLNQGSIQNLKSKIARNTSKAVEKSLSTIRSINPVTKTDRFRGSSPEKIFKSAPLDKSGENRIIQIQLFEYESPDDDRRKRSTFEFLASSRSRRLRHFSPQADPNLYLVEVRTIDELEALAELPMVRGIEFLPCFSPISPAAFNRAAMRSLTDPDRPDPKDCPIVAVVDTGVDDTVEQLSPWIAGRQQYVAANEFQPDHGTFVAGLIVWGDKLNPELENIEPLPCRILDVQLLPNKQASSGPNARCNAEEFIQGLEESIRQHPEVKVWNLSLSSNNQVSLRDFSQEAKQLDDLQERYGISIVVAAGNYPGNSDADRLPYPRSELEKSQGRITTPADSVLAITVGAVAHIDHPKGVLGGETSPFSRNGPGPNYIIKPDVSHYGGNVAIAGRAQPLGLTSTTIGNYLADDIGTSFATPLISRQLAYIYATVNPTPSPVTARAILTHSARDIRAANPGGRVADSDDHLMGFGVPLKILQSIECEPWKMTMIFEEEVYNRYKLEWDHFPYPDCLIKDGKFTGEVWMTLAYNPKRNTQWGSEYCETHVNAHFGTVSTKDQKEKFTGQVPVEHKNTKEHFEAWQIKSLRKWAPVRTYHEIFKRGISGDRWKLYIDLISRHGNQTPQNFTLLLTIADPEKRRPVYNELSVKLAQRLQTQNLMLRPQVRNRLSQ